jgi:hypothetical protein
MKHRLALLNYLRGAGPGFANRNLLSTEHRLVFGFSPKAACTVGARLFFSHIGKLDEALAYHRHIHMYRKVYTRAHRLDVSRHWNGDFVKIKLVRNPFSRAVSGYTHAMITGFMDRDLRRFFKLEDPKDLSFSRFLEYLEAHRNFRLDPHIDVQVFREEGSRYPYDYILKIEELKAGVADIERRFGIRFDLNDRLLHSPHHRRKLAAGEGDCSEVPFRELVQHVDGGPSVPPHGDFYGPATRARVAELFRLDLDSYGYHDPA